MKTTLVLFGKTTSFEETLLKHPDVIEGLQWGFPRPGHPEGENIHHVNDVLQNVETKYLSGEITKDEYQKLRTIAILHDTFKGECDRSLRGQVDKRHLWDHAMIAARKAEKLGCSPEICLIIELHDNAYRIWRKTKNKPAKRASLYTALYNQLGDHVALFTHFNECDNNTGDKTMHPFLSWKSFVDSYS